MNVSEAVTRRMAIRAFRPDPVPGDLVREILDLARRSPSGGNLQPWKVYALGGQDLADFKAIIAEKLKAGVKETPEYNVYPPNLWEPLRKRRRETGALRYAALGVSEKDAAGLQALTEKNYEFFGAPVGLFFCLDRRCGPPQWSDVGMLMLTVMLLAVERGLDTCPQEIWSNWPKTIAEYVKLPDDHMVFAGMSMGYRDPDHVLAKLRTTRVPLEENMEIRGF